MFSQVRGVSMMVLCSLSMMIAGCAEDNEASVKNQAESNAAKGAPAEAPAGSQSKDQTEYFKKQQEIQSKAFSKDSGYPTPKADAAEKTEKTENTETPK